MLLTNLESSIYSCGIVLVFWFRQEIVFGVTPYILIVEYKTVVHCVGFWLWLEIVLKMRTPFDFL